MQISGILENLTKTDTLPVLAFDLQSVANTIGKTSSEKELTKLAADAIVISTKIAYISNSKSAIKADIALGLSLSDNIRDLVTIKEVE